MFDCHLDPSDKDSDTFSITVQILRHGNCKELLTWLKKFRTLERGLLIKTDKARFQLARQILEGEGRRAFDNSAASSILKRNNIAQNQNKDKKDDDSKKSSSTSSGSSGSSSSSSSSGNSSESTDKISRKKRKAS
eukprot:scaffold72637_cov32-Attheya_sp.AAC.1